MNLLVSYIRIIIVIPLAFLVSCSPDETVYIRVENNASLLPFSFAATELVEKLGAIYPETHFSIDSSRTGRKRVIYLNTGDSVPSSDIEIEQPARVQN